jgi:putative hemolysin
VTQELLVIVALILVNGVFSGAEIALIALRRTRLRELAAAGSSRARAALALRDQPERFLATVQIGITAVGVTAAAYGGNALAVDLTPALESVGLGPYSRDVALLIVVVAVTFLSVVLGELVPKSLALHGAEVYGLSVARPLLGLSRLMRPLVWILTASANLVLRLFRDRTTFAETRHSREELQQFVEDAAESGALDPRSGEIASRAFDFAGLLVSAVMVPRAGIVALDRAEEPEALLSLLRTGGHAHYPVFEGSLDHSAGYVVVREALAEAAAGRPIDLERLVRPVPFVAETTPAPAVLRELQRMRSHLALVVDEHGSVAGLVTIEDLVEEIVGEILSEHDEPPLRILTEGEGRFVVPGEMPVHEVNRELDVSLPEGAGFDTVAGLLIERRGWIPRTGDRFDLPGGLVLEVLESTPRRVKRVRIHRPEAAQEAESP